MGRRWLWIVLMLLLAGCGGGSGTTGSVGEGAVTGAPGSKLPPLVTKPILGSTRNIVFLGDSITQYGTYPGVVADAVGVNGINEGQAGEKILEMLERLNVSVIIWHPTVCVLMCGTNDAYYLTPPAQFQASLVILLNRLTASGIPVVVVTPPHFAVGLSDRGRDLNASLASLVTILRAESVRRGLVTAEVNNAAVTLTPDGVHPNAAGQAVIAAIVTPAVEAALATH